MSFVTWLILVKTILTYGTNLHIRLTVKHEGLSRRGWKLLPWWRKMPYICRWLTEWWNSHWPWRWQVNPNRSLSCKSWVIKSLLGSRDRLWEIWLWSCSWLVESWLRPRVWLVKTRLVYSWWVKWWLWGRLIEPRRGTWLVKIRLIKTWLTAGWVKTSLWARWIKAGLRTRWIKSWLVESRLSKACLWPRGIKARLLTRSRRIKVRRGLIKSLLLAWLVKALPWWTERWWWCVLIGNREVIVKKWRWRNWRRISLIKHRMVRKPWLCKQWKTYLLIQHLTKLTKVITIKISNWIYKNTTV